MLDQKSAFAGSEPQGLSHPPRRSEQFPSLSPEQYVPIGGGGLGLARIGLTLLHANLTQPLHAEQAQARPATGIFDAYANTCQRWGLTQEDQATLLGYKGQSYWVEQMLLGRVPVRTIDVRDRVGFVLAISLGLGALYNEDRSAEVNWLQSEHAQLREAPLAFMLQGHMRNLITVSDIVRRMRGL